MSNLPETSQWDTGIYQIATTDPVLGGVDGIANKAARQLANRTLWLKEQLDLYSLRGYSNARQYRAGDIIFVADDDNTPHVGNFYEAYHPDGCLGKDPRDPVNRPDGWTNTDPSAPYYWIKLGKWLDLPTIGTPIGLFTTTVSQGYLKLNGTTVNATKFWRLAQTYPDLVTGGNINLPDLRAEFIRGLDDGRGVDTGRVVGSAQGGLIESHRHTATGWGRNVFDSTGGHLWHGMDTPTAGTSSLLYTDHFGGNETRPRNIALLYVTRF